MRETGEPWLGAIPADWTTHRVKSFFEIRKRIVGELGHDVLSVTQKGLRVRDVESNDGQLSMDYSKYQIVEVGDFVMNHMDLLTGFVDAANMSGVTSPDYRVFAPRFTAQLCPRYFLYLFQNGYRQRIFYAYGQGASEFGRWRMPTDNFNSFVLPVPPLSEQSAIAAHLDRETAKIDALVGEQRRLIELLKEKRQAVISHAVTRGLNPNTKMKASGVDWLGEVPEHWGVKRLRFLCDITTGDGDTADAVKDGEYPFYVRSPVVESIGRFSHDCEAVLTSGDGAGVGKIFHHVTGKFAAHQRVYIFDRFREVSGGFFFNYLRENFYKVALAGGAKSTVDSLRRPLIANFWITVPPVSEQDAIVGEAERLSEEFEQLIGETEKALALLHERRAALISAAVTGKIDVSHGASGVRTVTDTSRLRTLVAAEIIDQLSHKKTFGRVKLQKILYLAEAEAGIVELQGQYLREAAGPLDRSLIADVETGLQQSQHIAVAQPEGPGSQVLYHLLGKRGAFHDELVVAVGERAAALNSLIGKIGDLDTRSVEAVTTLYAVWNDAIIDRGDPLDAAIVTGVLQDWHPEKSQKFKTDELHTWLAWMRRHGLVPRGDGPQTTTGRLFA